MKLSRILLLVLVGLLAVWAGDEARADYTWTNTATGASGFWTNGNLWATPANYPGSNAATDKAYLTNNTTAGATYTNILNFNLPNSLNTLVISNGAGGYAWLIVTNNAASTGVGLTNATFILGNGGGLQIDSGGLVSNTTTFTWTGTNGVINLNNNGTLIARGTFGNTSSGITGLVTSTSSAGGVWDLNGSQLLIGGAATSNNLLTVNNVTLTNAINVSFYNEILGSNNSFTMTNGAKFFSINGGAAVTVGGDNYSSNDTFSVLSGSTFVGGSGGYIGVNWPGLATSGFNNQIVVSGGSLSNNGACTFSGYSSGMTVTNGTVWMGRLTMSGGSNVFVNVLTNGTFNLLGGALYIGQNAASTDDVVNINGGILTNAGNIQVGNHDGSINSRLILTNGGKVFTTSTPNVGVVAGAAGTLTISDTSLLSVPGLTLGFAAGSTGVVIQTGGTVTIGGVLQIGAIANASALYNISGGTLMAQGIGVAGGSGGVQGGWGTLTISGTAFITNSGAGAYIGGNGGSVGQTGTVNQSGGTWNNGGQAIYVGYWRGAGPVPVGTYNLTGGVLTNLSNLQIGHSGGLGTMTISGSAYLGLSGAAFTMGGNSSGTGFVFQTGGTVDGGVGLSPLNVGVGLANDQGTYVLSGGTMTNMGAVTIAAIGSSLTISNGGNFFGGAVSVANIAGDSNDSYTVGGLGTISTVSNGAITVGAIAGAGGNKMSVTNANLMNSGGMTIGTGSSNNTVTVYTNGTWTALAKSGYSFVIGTSAATGNVLVVNGGTVTNVAGGNVEIGNSSTSFGNSLVISNGGQWAGGAILIGNTAGASNNTYQVGGLGLASTASNGNLTISQGGAMFNTLTVSNATLFGGVSVQIGLNTSNNTLSILSNGTVTLLPSSVTAIGYGTATGNVLTVNGGTLNAANIYVGQNGANGNSFTVTNGTVNFSLSGANTPSLEVGGQGGVSSSNTVLVLGGSTWTGAGTGTTALVDNYLQIGAANASAYNQMTINKSVVTNFTMVQILGSNNSLTLTNAAKLYLVPLNAGGPLNNIGSSDISSNNTLSILAGSFFSDLSARPVWILGYSNQLVVNGGTYTNANSGSALSGGVLIGGTGSGVTVTNGLFSSFGVAVGIYNSIQFGTNDFFNVLGGGTANLNNASLNVGGSGGGSNSVTVNGGILTNVALVTVGATGSGFNTMTVTNAKVWTTDLTIGSGASNNAVNVQANAVWNLLGNTVTIGTGAATGNVLTVSSGGVLTNASTVTISSSNVLNLQGGSLFSTAVTNLAGGVITNFGALAGLVYNQGTVAVNGGTLAFLGGLTNQGVLTVLTGGMASFTNAAGSYVFTNYSGGTVNLQGGTIRDKDFVNQGQFNTTGGLISNALINDLGAFMYVSSGVTTATPDLTNYGVITNASTLQVGLTGAGPVVNTNLFVMQGGTLIAGSITNTSSGTFQLAATGTNTLRTTTFVNNGTISMANGQTLTFGGGTTLAITGTGVVTTPGGPVNLNIPASATLSFQNSGASAIQIGALTLPTGSVLEQKNGTGNTYTWSGSFDGANALGSFVLSSGTFQLGNSINMNLGQDFIIAGAATIDLNGFNLTNAVGRAITNKNVAATITSTSAGGGTLVNNGNLWGGSALTITNVTIDTFGTNNITGTWTLQGGSPGILLLRSDSLLRARATATITGAGQITNTGPANLEVDGGNLTISTTGGISFNVKSLVISNGATLTFSTPGALIGSTIGWQGSMTATGNITFAGGASHGEPWTFLRLDGDVDESLGQGLTFSPVQNNGQGGILFNGHNLTNETGSTVSFVAGATRVAYLSSPTPASFVNKGNLILTPGSITLSITNVTVDNVGTLNFGGSTAYANGLNLQGGANTILLLRSNSTVRATTTASITGGKIQSDTNALTGAPLPVNLEVDAGTFSIIPATGNNPSLNVQSLIIANGATLNFAGNGDGVSMNIGWRGSMTAAGNLTIGNAVIFSGAGCYLSLEGDVDEQLGQGLVFNPPQNGNGGILFNGHSLTNEAGSVVSIANGGGRRDAVFSSAGSPGFLVNYGSLTMTVGSALFSLTVTNVTVANSGTWNLSVPTVTLLSGGVLSNAVTGTLLNAGGTPRITGSSSGAFRNLGTVSVGSGTLTIDTVDSSQWGVGGWLRAGTWLVGGTGTLNLKPLDTTAISVISTNATVIYAGGGTIQVGGGTYVSLTNSLNAIAGTLFLSNSTFNSGTALFAITNGTLQLNAGTLTTRSILLTNTGTIFGSGGVSGFSKLINNGTIRATNGVLTIAGLITGTGASFADTGGTLPLTNANSYTGMTVIDGGQLVVGDPNAVQNSMVSNTTAANGIIFSNVNNANFGGLAGTGDFGLTNGAAGVALSVSNAVNSTYSGALSGSGSLTKGGAGTLVLAGNNTYSGGTTISNGALQAANNTALGSGLVTNLAGGEIQFANNVTVGNTLMLFGTGVANDGALRNISGNNSYTGAVTLGSAARINSDAGQLTVSNIVNSGFDLTVGGASTTLVVGVIGNGSGGLVKDGTGVLAVTAVQTYQGSTVLSNGTLQLGGGNNTLYTNSAITVISGTLDLGGYTQSNNNSVTLLSGLLTNGTVVMTGVSLQGQSGTISATLAGSAGLTKTGSNTLTLAGADTYLGATLVSNGTLAVNGSLYAVGVVNVTSNATLTGSASLGSVAISGGGTISPGNNGVGTITAAALNLAANSKIALDFSTGARSYDQILVTNLNGLIVNGGVLSLYQANTNTPFDLLGNYKLIQYNGTPLPSTDTNLFAVANKTQNRIYGFSVSGGWVTLSISSTGGLGWVGSAIDNYWNTSANWAGGSVPQPGDQLIFDGHTGLNNTNNLTAHTQFSGIYFNSSAGAFTLNGTAVDLLNDVINVSANPQTINLPLVLAASNLVFNTANGNVSVNGAISETNSSFTLTKDGAATLYLAGANTYSGGTILDAGTLSVSAISDSDASGISTSGVLTFHGGALQFTGAGTGSTLRGITNIGIAYIDVTNSAAQLTLGGVISGPNGLMKLGAGSLVLSGTNTYAGGTTISSGTVAIGADNNLGVSGALTLSGGTLETTNTFTLDSTRNLTLNSPGGTFNVDTNSTLTIGNTINNGTGSGALTKTGAGTLVLSNAANGYLGGTFINGGILALGSDGATNENQGALSTGLVTITGGAQLRLGGGADQSYAIGNGLALSTGTIYAVAGVQNLTGSLTVGSGGGTLSAQAGTNDLFLTGVVSGSGALTVYDTGTTGAGRGLVRFANNNNSYSGTLTISSNGNNGVVSVDAANALQFATVNDVSGYGNSLVFYQATAGATNFTLGALSGTANLTLQTWTNTAGGDPLVTGSAVTLTVGGNNGNTTYAGALGGSGTLVKTGTGMLTLSGANTNSGGITVSSGTLLLSGGDNRLFTNGAVTVAGGTLDLGGFTQTNGNTFAILSGILTNGTVAKSGADYLGQSGTISATLAGSAGFTKSTTGTLYLTGTQSYTGPTTLSNGTLVVNGALFGGGLVNVLSNATLTGNATLGNVTVGTGGLLVPGNNGIGTFAMGTLTTASGSLFNFDFTATTNDLLYVTANNGLTVTGGVFTLYQAGTTQTFDALGTYNLIDYAGTIGGLNVTNFTVANTIGNRSYTFGTNNHWVTMTIAGSGIGWNGSVSAYWANPTNWNGRIVPTNGTAVFNGNTQTATINDLADHAVLAGITFDTQASAFSLSGLATGTNSVNLEGDVSNLSSNVQTINLPLVLEGTGGGPRTFNASNGILIVNGVISETNGVFSLVKEGANLLVLAGANTYSGGTVLNAGTLGIGVSSIGSTGALGTGTLFIHGGSLLATNAAQTLNNAVSVVGDFSVGGNQDLTLAGSINLSNATRTLTIDNTANTFIAGIVSNGALTKAGNGLLTVTGTLAYNGVTTINGGTLQLGNGGNTGTINNNAAVTDNSALAFYRSDDLSFANLITGTGDVVQNGTNVFTITDGNNSYSGRTVINGGVVSVNFLTNGGVASAIGAASSAASNLVLNGGALQYTGSGATIDRLFTLGDNGGTLSASGGALNLTNPGALGMAGTLSRTLVLTGNSNGTLAASIGDPTSGQTTLLKAGNNLWVLSNTNTFSGLTTISGGTLLLAGALAAQNSTVSNLIDGGLTFTNSASFILGGLAGLGNLGLTNTSGGSITLSVGNNNLNTTYLGVLSGSGALTKLGSGTLTLSSNQTYLGGTTVSAGTLQLGGLANTLSTNGAITVAGGILNLGGTGQFTTNAVTISSGSLVNGTLTKSGANYDGQGGTVAAVLAGNVGLTKTSGGTLVLTGTNTYTGATLISNGTLQVNGKLLTNGLVMVASGATLAGNGGTVGTVTVNSGGIVAPGISGVGTLTLTSLNVTNGSLFNYDFSGTANDQLFVTTTNGLTINGGDFRLYQAGTTTTFDTLGTYKLISYAGLIQGSGTNNLLIDPTTQTGNRLYTFGTNGGWVTLTIAGQGIGWLGANSALWADPGNWAGNVVPTNGIAIFLGTSQLNTTNNLVNAQFVGITFTNGAGAFTLNSALAGANTVTLQGDVVNLSANAQTINLPLLIAGAQGGKFNASNADLVVAGKITFDSYASGLLKTGPNVLELTGNNTYTQTTTMAGGILRVNSSGLSPNSNLIFTNGVLESSAPMTLNRSLGTGGGSIQWAGSGGFSAKGGTLTVNLGGAGGTLVWGASSFVPNGSTLQFSSSQADSTVSFLNALNLNGGVRTIQVDNGSAFVDVDLAGAISGTSGSGLIKTGAGTMRLSGNSSFSGALTVDAGTFLLAATLSNTSVFVSSGATLGGTGVFASALTLGNGGILAPGIGGAGLLTVSSLNLSNGFVYDWELGVTATDQVTVTTLNGLNYFGSNQWTLQLGTEPGVAGLAQWQGSGVLTDSFVLFQLNGSAPASLTNALILGGGGWDASQAKVSIVGNQVLLSGVMFNQTLAVIPEPNVLLMWLAGGVTLWAARRRNKSRQSA